MIREMTVEQSVEHVRLYAVQTSAFYWVMFWKISDAQAIGIPISLN